MLMVFWTFGICLLKGGPLKAKRIKENCYQHFTTEYHLNVISNVLWFIHTKLSLTMESKSERQNNLTQLFNFETNIDVTSIIFLLKFSLKDNFFKIYDRNVAKVHLFKKQTTISSEKIMKSINTRNI